MNKVIFLILFFIPVVTFGQRGSDYAKRQADKENLKYYELVFGDKEKDFQLTEAPQKWATEPLVMLCQKYHLSFFRDTKTNSSKIKGVYRKRVLLQDKNAVEDLSEFYFQESETIRINLIKKNGTEQEIPISNSIKVETEIPKFYGSDFQSTEYYKIAIPNLEVGDILDFFVVFSEIKNTTISFFSLLPRNYPIVDQEIIFDVDKLWSFFYNNFNGAPELKSDPEGGLDINGRKRKMVKRFVLTDKDREAFTPERWDMEYRTLPMFKIMAVSPTNAIYKIGKRDVIAQKIDVLKTAKKTINQVSINTYYIADIKRKVKYAKISKSNKKELTNFIFYALRETFLDNLTTQKINETLAHSPDTEKVIRNNERVEMSSPFFARHFAQALDIYDIPCKMIAAVPRAFGELEDVITDMEIVYGIYVPETKEYYWPVNSYYNHTDKYSILNNAPALLIDYNSLSKSKPVYKEITLPAQVPTENSIYKTMDIDINEQFNLLSIKSKIVMNGKSKENFASIFFPLDLDYIRKDFNNMFPNEEIPESKSKRARERIAQNRKQVKSKLEKKKEESAEKWLESDHSIKEVDHFEIIQTGRTKDQQQLEIEAAYSTEDYIGKAGPNFILEVGKFIGGQIELQEKEINDRKHNVEFEYPRQYEYVMNIKIPDGYKVENLDALNYNVVHKDAAFISTAKLEGNVLKATTSKQYINVTAPKSAWPEIVEMLEAAFQFSQAKVVLKKA